MRAVVGASDDLGGVVAGCPAVEGGACPLLGTRRAPVWTTTGICSLAVTESALWPSRKVSGPSVAAPRGFATDRRVGASDTCTDPEGDRTQIIQLSRSRPAIRSARSASGTPGRVRHCTGRGGGRRAPGAAVHHFFDVGSLRGGGSHGLPLRSRSSPGSGPPCWRDRGLARAGGASHTSAAPRRVRMRR